LAKEREILEAIDQYYGEGQTSIEKIVKGTARRKAGRQARNAKMWITYETSRPRPRSSSS